MVKNKVAIITGASKGIGKAISEKLFSEGYNVGLLSRNIKQIDEKGILSCRCDVRNLQSIENAVSVFAERFGGIDVVVNSAGAVEVDSFQNLKVDSLDRMYDIHVKGFFNITKASLPYLKKRKSGYIINICSLRGTIPSSSKAAYCMSKAASIMFSKVIREELKPFGIRVSIINPGFVNTALYGKDSKRPFAFDEKGKLKSIKITEPIDIAKAVLFLLSLSEGAEICELNIGRTFRKTDHFVLRKI